MFHHSGQAVGLFKIGAGLKLQHDGKLATVGYLDKLPSYLAENKQAEGGGKQEYRAEKDFAGITETPLQKIEIELAKALIVLFESDGKLFEKVSASKLFDFREA